MLKRILEQCAGSAGRGYQSGLIAMAVAGPFASLVAVLAGLPSPLEGTAETLMEWTPVPIASFLLIHLGGVARPAALLGAFAAALLCGGIAGAIGNIVGGVIRVAGRRPVVAGTRAGQPGRTSERRGSGYPVVDQTGTAEDPPGETLKRGEISGRAQIAPTTVEVGEAAHANRGRRSSPPRPEWERGLGGEGIPGQRGRARQEPTPTTISISVIVSGAVLAAVFLGMLSPAAVGSVVLMVAAFAAMMVGLEYRPVPRTGKREFLVRTGAIVGGAGALVALFWLRPLVWAAGGRRIGTYHPPNGLSTAGVTDLVTPSHRFYVNDKVLQPPDLTVTGWRFTVGGAVRRPVRLDYAGLLARPATQRYITMECVDNPVGGPLIGNALWTGVRVADLLDEAGAKGEMVIFSAGDDYAEGMPRKLLERHDALVVYAMNGETLSRDHGFPARLLVPGLYGFKSVKWLTGMEVAAGTYEDIWSRRGWSEAPVVHTTTRIDVARRNGDRVEVAGIAFAGDRGVRAVEVRVNGGRWMRVRLGPALGRAAWVQWEVAVRAGRNTRIEARAIDGLGHVQPGREHSAYPDGASGWATVTA